MSRNTILAYSLGFLLLGFLVQISLPWYSLAFLALIFGFMMKVKPGITFLVFLICGALLWLITAYWKDAQSHSQLSTRVAILFGVGQTIILLVATALIGGITSGLGAWCGSTFGKYLRE